MNSPNAGSIVKWSKIFLLKQYPLSVFTAVTFTSNDQDEESTTFPLTDPRNRQRQCGMHYVQLNTTRPQKEWILPFAMTWMELGNSLKGKGKTKRSQVQEDEKC